MYHYFMVKRGIVLIEIEHQCFLVLNTGKNVPLQAAYLGLEFYT